MGTSTTKLFYIVIITSLIFVTATFFIFSKKIEDRKLVFWTLQMNDFAPYINRVISDFEAENPQIKIKWVDVPFSEGEKRTLASVLSDNPPDLVNLNPDFSATLAHKGALEEINKEKIEQFNKQIMNALEIDGKYYSVPFYATSAITIYNKEITKKSGISVPRTYFEISKYAPIVKSKTNSYIIFPNLVENDAMLKILNKYGCANSDNINSLKSVEIFELFKMLYIKNLIPKETLTVSLQEALEKYMSGSVMMINAGANFLNMVKENAPQTYKVTDVAPQVTGELGQFDFSLMNFVIPKRAKNKDEALKFALFLTNHENQLELAKLTNVLAVNKQTLNNEFYTKYDKNDLVSKARVISAKQLEKINPVYHTQRNQKDINLIVNSATQEILLEKSSIKNILDKVAKDWKDLEE